MPTDLAGWTGASAQVPIVSVKIRGAEFANVIAVDVTIGVEQQSSEATIRLAAEDYPSWAFVHTAVEIRMGYGGPGGGTRLVFVGELQDTDTTFAPYYVELKAAGFLKRAQRNAGQTLASGDPGDLAGPIITWNNVTDSQIWNDLMRLAGVPEYHSGDGDGRTIVGPVELLPGDNIRSKIDDLDNASNGGWKTFEYAGQVYRTPALRIPAGRPSWSYVEGKPNPTGIPPSWALYSLQRQQTDRDVKNQVIIQGRQAAGDDTPNIAAAVRQQPSPYWGNDGNGQPIYVPFQMSSDFLETRDQCDLVAQRYMYEHNKVTDVVQMRTPLNPFAMPSLTVGITSDRLGLRTRTNYWVRQIHHHWGTDGASTDWTLEGGAGSTGYLVGLPPVALFEMKVTKESYQQGSYDIPVPTYTVVCDGSGSYDPDGTALTFAWSASNGATGNGVTFTTTFTEAQWSPDDPASGGATITLTVTDSDEPDAHHDTNGPVTAGDTGAQDGAEAKVIAMYVAALGMAYATPDGWETVNQWTPPSPAISVGRIAAEGTNYFGLSNGGLYKTTDYLASAPTLAWTAPQGITAIWISELDARIVAVGLANGDFYLTQDGFLTVPVLKRNFGHHIDWINGSRQRKTQWRVCVGQDVWITNYDWERGDFHVLVSFGGEDTVQNELTPFANYVAASGTAGQPVLKQERADSPPYTFPSLSPAPSEVHVTNFIDRDSLLIGDDQGRSFLATSDIGAAAVQMTNIGAGYVHDMLRDNTNFQAAYAACDLGLMKTYDAAKTWVRVLTFNGAGVKGMRIGYDSAPLLPPVLLPHALIEVSFTGVGSAAAGEKGHQQYDDPVVNKRGMDMWNPTLSCGGGPDYCERNDPLPTGWYLKANWPDKDATYKPGEYTHYWRDGESILTSIYMGQEEFFDYAWGGQLKSELSGSYMWSGSSGSPSPGPGAEIIYLHRFKLPAMTIGKTIISLYTYYRGRTITGGPGTDDDYTMWAPHQLVLDFYINDTRVPEVVLIEQRDTPAYLNIPLNSSLFVADGETWNQVAMHVKKNDTYAGPRIGYKIAFGADPGSVSLYSTDDGRYVWASSQESSVHVYGGMSGSTPNDPLPSGWYNIDASVPLPIGGAQCQVWPPAVHNGIYANPWPDYNQYGTKLANMNGTDRSGAQYVHKQSIDMPIGDDTSWRLVIRKKDFDMQLTDVYINGTRLGTASPTSPARDTGNNHTNPTNSSGFAQTRVHLYSFDVPAGMMHMGARNTVAFLIETPFDTNPSSNFANNMAWYFEQSPPDPYFTARALVSL